MLVPDTGALRALLERIEKARFVALSEHSLFISHMPKLVIVNDSHLPAQTAHTGSLHLLTVLLRLMPPKPPCAWLQHALPCLLT